MKQPSHHSGITPEDLDAAWKAILEKAQAITGYCEADASVLQESAEQLLPRREGIVSSFYDSFLSYPETTEVLNKLKLNKSKREELLLHWLKILMQGKHDDSFWRWQWLVGLAQVQHRIAPVYTLSMLAQLQSLIIEVVFDIFDAESAERLSLAYTRSIGCITALTIECCHQEFTSVVNITGLSNSVLTRMISMEVKKKAELYQGSLPDHLLYATQ